MSPYSSLGLHFLRGVMEESSDLFAAMCPDFKLLAFNPAFERAFELVYGERVALGVDLREVLAHLPAEQEKVARLWGRALKGEEFKVIEDFGRDSADRRFFEISFKPVKDSQGELLGAYQLVRDVTEKASVRRELQQSDALVQSFFDSIPLMVGIVELWDNDVLHIQDNPPSCQFFGLPPGWTQGRRLSEVSPSRHLVQQWREKYLQSQATGLPVRFEYDHTSSQKTATLSVTVNFVSIGPSGRPRFCYVIEDITHQRQIEGELRKRQIELAQRVEARTYELAESEKRSRDLFEKVAIGIARVSLDGRFVRVNPRVVAITGYSSEELTGRPVRELTHPDNQDQEKEMLSGLMAGELTECSFEARWLTKNQTYTWVKVQVTLSLGEREKAPYFIYSVEDISEAKSLQIEQTRLYELPNHLLCVLDEQSRFKRVNAGFTRVLGYLPEELIGQPIWKFILPEDLERSISTEDLARTTVITASENRFRTRSGEYRWIRWTGTIIDGLNYAAAIDITELKRIQSDLEEDREKLSLAVQAARVGFYDWDIRTNQVEFSAQMRKDWGLTEEQGSLSLEQALQLIHPEDREAVSQAIEKTVLHQVPYSIQYRVLRKDGEVIWVTVSGTVIRNAGGEPLRFFGTSINITEFKRAVDFAATQQKWVEKILDELPVPLSLIRAKDGSLSFSNRAALENALDIPEKITPELESVYFAQTPEGENIPLEELPRFKVSRGEDILGREILWNSPKGRVPLLIHGRYLPPSEGHEAMGIISVLDLTQQKKDQDELRRTSELLSALMRSSSDVIYVKDRESKMIYCNPTTLRLTGLSESELYGKNDVEFLGPGKGGEQILESDRRIMESGHGETVEEWVTWRNGTQCLYMSRKEPYRDHRGKVIGLLGISRDITDLKHSQSELEEAVRARDEFLSIASHELKTPLTSLKLQTQLQQRAVQRADAAAYSPERVSKWASQIDKQIQRLTRLVDDMLDVSRIRTGRLTMERESFDLCELMREVVERLKDQFISNRYPVPQISGCSDTVGTWDRMRIEQVITNLLTNAIRYGNHQPISVRIASTFEQVRIEVQDRGIGIAPEARDRIFNRFERAIDANEVSGLGLGLFITRQIVQAHHGKIWVESQLGKGSTFIVELPRGKVELGSPGLALAIAATATSKNVGPA
jgi:PAS domain S-box-containing protein